MKKLSVVVLMILFPFLSIGQTLGADSIVLSLPGNISGAHSGQFVIIHESGEYQCIANADSLLAELAKWLKSSDGKWISNLIVQLDSMKNRDTVDLFQPNLNTSEGAMLESVSYYLLGTNGCVIRNRSTGKTLRRVVIRDYDDVGTSGKLVIIDGKEFLRLIEIIY